LKKDAFVTSPILAGSEMFDLRLEYAGQLVLEGATNPDATCRQFLSEAEEDTTFDTCFQVEKLTLKGSDLDVQSHAQITAAGMGYAGALFTYKNSPEDGESPSGTNGGGTSSDTTGNSNDGGGGGAHFGAGGNSATGHSGGASYDDAVSPLYAGSGGGAGEAGSGGNGGGYIFIEVSNSMNVNGLITAHGVSGEDNIHSDRGAGGLSADGGAGGYDGSLSSAFGGGGGGGIISYYYQEYQGFLSMHVAGGAGGGGTSQAGQTGIAYGQQL
jgi:hypothetical protein